MAKLKQNLNGQDMGAKGQLTRSRIMEATAILVERRPMRELKVAEIGAHAAVSASTFYLYFESVPDAVLAVVEDLLNQSTPELMAIFDQEWTGKNMMEVAKQFVQTYVSFWDRHHALLRVRNFAADEGDRRFLDSRRRSVEPIHFALQEKIRRFQESTPNAIRLHPPSTVSVTLAMLERTAAILRQPSAHKATRTGLIESAIFLFAEAISGSRADVTNAGKIGQ
jgi:AcrR family transcriptional regulator